MRKEGSDIDPSLHTFPEPMAHVTVTTVFEPSCPIQRKSKSESFIQTLKEQPVLLSWKIQQLAHSRNSEEKKVLDKKFPFKEILHE